MKYVNYCGYSKINGKNESISFINPECSYDSYTVPYASEFNESEFYIATDDASRDFCIYIHKKCDKKFDEKFKCNKKDCDHTISGKVPLMIIENGTNWDRLPAIFLNETFIKIDNFKYNKDYREHNESLEKQLLTTYDQTHVLDCSYYTSIRCKACRTRFEWSEDHLMKKSQF